MTHVTPLQVQQFAYARKPVHRNDFVSKCSTATMFAMFNVQCSMFNVQFILMLKSSQVDRVMGALLDI